YTTHMDKATDHDGGREYWPSWRTESFRNPQAAAVLSRYHNRPAEELYDVQADPWERVNLAADPAFSTLLKQFRKEMAVIRKEQGDRETGPEDLTASKTDHGAPQEPVAPYVF